MGQIFPFAGSVGRLDFVLRIFAFVIITTVIEIVFPSYRGGPTGQLLLIVLAVMLIAAFAGRLRDAGFSPWFSLVILVPVVGWLVVLVFMVWGGRQ